MKKFALCLLMAVLCVAVNAVSWAQTNEVVSWKDLYMEAEQLLEAGKYEQAKQVSEEGYELVKREVGQETADTAASMSQLGEILLEWGEIKEGERLIDQALVVRKRLFGDQDLTYLESELVKAKYDRICDRLDVAQERAERILTLREAALGTEHEDVLDTLLELGQIYVSQYKIENARVVKERALNLARTLYGESHRKVLIARRGAISLLLHSGEYQEAIVLIESVYNDTIKLLGDEHPDVAEVLFEMAAVNTYLDRHREAERLLQKSLDIYETTVEENHYAVSYGKRYIGQMAGQRDDYQAALRLYDEAIAGFEAIFDAEHKDAIQAKVDRAWVWYKQGKKREAAEVFQYAAEHFKHVDEKGLAYGQSLLNLGWYYDSEYKSDLAEDYYRKAIAVLTPIYGQNHPEILSQMEYLAAAMGRQGKNVEVVLKDILQRNVKLYGKDSSQVADVHINLGEYYREKGMFDESEQQYQLALTICEGNEDESELDVAIIKHNVGYLYMARGDFSRAKLFYEEALDVYVKVNGDEHDASLSCLMHLGDACGQLNLLKEATGYYKRAVKVAKALHGEKAMETGSVMFRLGWTYHQQRRWQQAEYLYKKVFDIYQAELGEDNEYTIRLLQYTARLYDDMGKPELADSLRKEIAAIQRAK